MSKIMANEEDSFYQLLQLGPHQMKAKIKAQPKGQRKKYIFNMIVRNLLIVIFAIVFVGGASAIFGKNNTSVAVAFFCILLQSRYVNYGYRIKDSLINLAVMSAIFAIDSQIAPKLPIILSLIANLIFFSIIILMTCDNPLLGNVAVYVDSYLFTTFMGPENFHELKLRFIEVIIGFLICAYSLYKNNKNKDKTTTFIDKLKTFDIYSDKTQWQIKVIVGLSLVLCVSQLLHIDRYFWVAIAGLSVFAPFGKFSMIKRVIARIFGVIVGSFLFLLLSSVVPSSFVSLIGPLGGFLIGFSTTYHWNSAFNCFGALSLATSIYGLRFSLILRITNNLIGCVISFIFVLIYLFLISRLKAKTNKTQN